MFNAGSQCDRLTLRTTTVQGSAVCGELCGIQTFVSDNSSIQLAYAIQSLNPFFLHHLCLLMLTLQAIKMADGLQFQVVLLQKKKKIKNPNEGNKAFENPALEVPLSWCFTVYLLHSEGYGFF